MEPHARPFFASVRDWRHWPELFGRVTATHNYVPQIDGLRFLAIIQVVIYHAAVRAQRLSSPGFEASEGWVRYWPNGVAGVELFFFISGYIIAYPFVSGRKPSLRAFYMRRVTRLEPPYILTVLICTLFYVGMFGTSLRSDGGSHVASEGNLMSHMAASLVYAHGLVFHNSPPFNPPLWTLEIEIQFYLVAPLLIAGFLMLRPGKLRMAFAGVATIGAIALQALLDPVPAWHYSLASHLFAFVFGVAVSDWAVRAKPLEREPVLGKKAEFGPDDLVWQNRSHRRGWLPIRGQVDGAGPRFTTTAALNCSIVEEADVIANTCGEPIASNFAVSGV